MALDRRQLARAAAFVGHPELLADAEREVRVVIEEERRDVIVVDEEQHVGLLLGQPALDGLVAGEDGRPHRVLLLLRVEREADGGRVRGGDAADDGGHERSGCTRARYRRPGAGMPASEGISRPMVESPAGGSATSRHAESAHHRRGVRHRARNRAGLRQGGRARVRGRYRCAGARTRCAPIRWPSPRKSATWRISRRSKRWCRGRSRRSAGSTCWSTTPASPGPTALVENYDPREWDRVMRVNLGATFNVTRLAIPHLQEIRTRAASSTCHRPPGGSAIRSAAPTPPASGASSASRRRCRWSWVRMAFAPTPSCPGPWPVRAWSACSKGAPSTSGRTHRRRARQRAGESVAQDFHRADRDRGAGAVPGIRCGEDHLRSGAIHRRRHAPLGLDSRTDSGAE